MKRKIENRLDEILKTKNITPYRLAKNLGVPAPTVYNWVSNKTNPSEKYLWDILVILGVNIKDFYKVIYD